MLGVIVPMDLSPLERPPRTLLEQLVRQREATYEEQIREFEELARRLGEPATLSVRHLQRLASGERSGDRSTPSVRRVLRQLYGHPLEELLGPPAPAPARTASSLAIAQAPAAGPDPRLLTTTAARASLEFAAWADADQLAPSVMEHVSYELGRIAVDYVSTPALPLLQDLVELRDTMVQLLRTGPHPRQSRELFFLAGTTCLLMAHASQNLGDSSAAMAQARTAWTCAEQADHDGLRAWVRGTQALIAEWSRRPAEAIKFSQAGRPHAHTPDARVRLAAIEARTQARLGNADAALAAVEEVRRARETPERGDDLGFGGLLTFPVAKQQYYVGTTLALIGDHGPAERAALEAIGMYEAGSPEQRSYGDEALARVDVATARLAAGDLEGARAALQDVLTLPPDKRIQQLRDGLVRVRSVLALPRTARASEAVLLAADLDEFSAVSPSTASVLSQRAR